MYFVLELIRLLAVLLITFTHTRNEFVEGEFVFFIFNDLPKIGTLLLSIISGFLYIKVSKDKTNLFKTKVKTLLIPFLLANLLILSLVLIANFVIGVNFLNRLNFDYKLITEGLFSLNSPPINPPTYFIRDIFIVFTIIELIRYRNLKMLLIVIPVIIFGKLFLRIDIPLLFLLGMLIGYYSEYFSRNKFFVLIFIIVSIISYIWVYTFNIDVLKYFIAFFVFILVFDLNIKFYNVGAYSYLVHLYHSPIMVVSYPIINKFITHPVWNVLLQVAVAIVLTYFIFIITRKFKKLRILCGGK